ncbi:MAG: insulinase family protein, partial [Candidatus Omnitrophica bacterium]|nr:insulinase family protein [Candidatus Omnitrophota bacterium]
MLLYKKKTLDNRLNIVSSPMSHMESVSIGIWIGMGGRYEDKELSGITHFIEHMLFKGTTTRTVSQLKQEIEGVGGHFNAFTSEEVTCYLVKLPARHYMLGLDVLCDMVANPRLSEVDIELEREVIYEEIKMYRDQPASYVHEILASTMWGNHPLGRPLTGTTETVKGIGRKDLVDYKEKFYTPRNISVVATGKMWIHKFLEGVTMRLGPGNQRGKTPHYENFEVKQKQKKLKFHFKSTEQTHIALGFHAPGRKSKDRYTLGLLNIILGGNMSSRLFEELREKRALCYDVSSSLKKYEETGAFFIHAGIDNSKTEVALESIMKELIDLKRNAVSNDELKRAKEYYKGQLLLALEDTSARMLWLGDKVMTKEGIPSVKSILKHIE